MKCVKITNGLYGYRPEGSKHPKPVSAGSLCIVTDKEATRLVSLGVGIAIKDVPAEGFSGAVATTVGDEGGSWVGVDIPPQDEGADGEETAHLDKEQLLQLTNDKLKELAEEMGIDTAKFKTKAQLIAAIADAPLENAIPNKWDDGEAPPDLGAEGPVE